MKFEVVLFAICVIYTEGSALIANKYDDYDEPKYAYDYSVNDIKTGDAKSQWETNENGIVKGEYSLVEPDGTLRIVEYEADPYFGFRAIVKKTYPSGHQTLDHYG
ncbi:cuticle protein 19-like [Rhodnius prolixus]|uniref:Putative cuticle protein 19 n=1 Tax=Rhodnius prolixus TaxID=13249 RepID=R4FQI8_RHOPR